MTNLLLKVSILVTDQITYNPKYEMEYLEKKIILPKKEYTTHPPIQV